MLIETSDVNFAGRSFRLAKCDGKDLAANAIGAGTFEAPLPIMLMAMIDRMEGDFLDVGANTGVYTVLAGMTRPDVHIHAFEPYPPVVEILRENIRMNSLEDRVTLHQVALSNTAGAATLYIPDASHGVIESSASLRPDFGDGVKTEVKITRQRLDDIDLPKIAAMKVDIEGHEADFLMGAIASIQRDRPVIFAEVLHLADTERLEAVLNEIGYMDFRLRPDIAIQAHRVGFDPLAWNHAFVPPEKMSVFRDACRTHSIEIVTPF